jgi:queuine tRNA-ribosyltransferase subunit QTRTD1
MIVSCGTPDDVLQAVSFGVDIINSDYPDLVTEHGCALIFPLSFSFLSQTSSEGKEEGEGDSYKMNLWDKKYQRDSSPILPHCSCFACTNHTRAYIHHLLNTHELLAPILLSMYVSSS